MQILSKVFVPKMVKSQLTSSFLSIYNNFSLGLLWKSFHKTVFVKYEVQQKAAKNPTPVSAAYV